MSIWNLYLLSLNRHPRSWVISSYTKFALCSPPPSPIAPFIYSMCMQVPYLTLQPSKLTSFWLKLGLNCCVYRVAVTTWRLHFIVLCHRKQCSLFTHLDVSFHFQTAYEAVALYQGNGVGVGVGGLYDGLSEPSLPTSTCSDTPLTLVSVCCIGPLQVCVTVLRSICILILYKFAGLFNGPQRDECCCFTTNRGHHYADEAEITSLSPCP